jgi:hypothetical protein
MSQFEAALVEFMGQGENCVRLLIPSFRHVLSSHSDTVGLESQLRCHILPLIGDGADSLLTLPLSVFSRAFLPMPILESFESAIARHQFFASLVRCLDHYGPSVCRPLRALQATKMPNLWTKTRIHIFIPTVALVSGFQLISKAGECRRLTILSWRGTIMARTSTT